MAIHKGPWQNEEDAILRNQVNLHNGANAWGKIAEALGTRSAKQCRERWHQNLKPGLQTGPITNDEARFITQYVQSRGKRWAEIARQMNGRSDNMIKNWWNGSNNRRQREQCDYRRAPEAPSHAYPMQLQQPLPSFQASYSPQGYTSAHSYGPSSPVQASGYTSAVSTSENSHYYSRDAPSNLYDRRSDWDTPSLQISPTQNTREARPSLSAVTTPSSAGPPTPRYGESHRASSTECPSVRAYEDSSSDPYVLQPTSRRGSAYEQQHYPQPQSNTHYSYSDVPTTLAKEAYQPQAPSKSKMSLSNILT